MTSLIHLRWLPLWALENSACFYDQDRLKQFCLLFPLMLLYIFYCNAFRWKQHVLIARLVQTWRWSETFVLFPCQGQWVIEWIRLVEQEWVDMHTEIRDSKLRSPQKLISYCAFCTSLLVSQAFCEQIWPAENKWEYCTRCPIRLCSVNTYGRFFSWLLLWS